MPDDFSASDFSAPLTAFLVFELVLFFTGLALLFRRRHDLLARVTGNATAKLAPMPNPFVDVVITTLYAIGGAVLAQSLVTHFGGRWAPPAADGTPGLYEVMAGAGFQIGLLAGLILAWLRLRISSGRSVPPPLPDRTTALQAVGAGARTVVMLLPLVWISGAIWKTLLDGLGIEAPPQDIVLIFKETGDHLALAAMLVFAVFIAPLTEELLFRVGLFRWLRTRIPRALALLVPAILFSLLHFSWAALLPLAVLAVGFAIAYERSGHPLTPITAHALFNLNTLVLLLLGFPA